MTTETMTTATMTADLESILDWAAENVNPEKRDRAMERAHNKGCDVCEVCGKELKPGSIVAVDPETDERMPIGPTCAKKLRQAGVLS